MSTIDGAFDEAQLAAAAFLARYTGRTLGATARIFAASFNGRQATPRCRPATGHALHDPVNRWSPRPDRLAVCTRFAHSLTRAAPLLATGALSASTPDWSRVLQNRRVQVRPLPSTLISRSSVDESTALRRRGSHVRVVAARQPSHAAVVQRTHGRALNPEARVRRPVAVPVTRCQVVGSSFNGEDLRPARVRKHGRHIGARRRGQGRAHRRLGRPRHLRPRRRRDPSSTDRSSIAAAASAATSTTSRAPSQSSIATTGRATASTATGQSRPTP